MEVSDRLMCANCDWDPSYLRQLFEEDFYEFSDLWVNSNVNDMELVQEADRMDKYIPIVEDISLDDETLCSAVEKIEHE